jgi:hypothetical protein
MAIKQIKITSVNTNLTVHIVLRVRSDDGRTMEEHVKVFNKSGRVLFAKIGKGLGAPFFNQLNYQIENKIPTYFFIAVYEGWNMPFSFIKCDLLKVHSTLTDKQLELVPSYIHSSKNAVNTWFEISGLSRLANEEVKRIQLATSGREISSSLRGTTAIFRVVVNGNAPLKTIPLELKAHKKQTTQSDDNDFVEDVDDDADYIDDFINSRT